MYNTYLMTQQEYQLYKKQMDTSTFDLFMTVCNEYTSTTGIPHPYLLIDCVCEDIGFFGKSQGDLKKKYHAYRKSGSLNYADFYKVLAFTIFGYGCWSNNDRRRNGLAPIRFIPLRKYTG